MIENYNVPFLLHPYVALLHQPRLSGAVHVLPVAADAFRPRLARALDGQRGAGICASRQAHFPQAKEFFFDDDTFNIRKDRVLELCKKFKPVGFQWSCTARVHSDYETLKAMADAGARLLIVGFESGDPQILKNIKKGATVEMARAFVKNCKKVGIRVHGDFIIGLPGETQETIQRTIDFAKELDCETIQVSMAHAYPGTELYTVARMPATSTAKRSPTTAATSSRISRSRAFRAKTS